MEGTIFDIQRFSVHDGPGIRTTVFMKGCPLRCQWCHNPEGLRPEQQLQFHQEQCIGCGACGQRSRLADAQACPSGALQVCGRRTSEEEVLRAVLRDRAFYGTGGGVTFSGGECLLQADFVAAVLAQAQANGLHTAVDTSGCVPWSQLEKTLAHCDLYLYDVKCLTPALHRAGTGADNALILENLRRLSAAGKEIWIRIPVIPGFNDSREEMTDIAAFLAGLPSVGPVTFMPYHTLGVSKYPTLGMVCPFQTDARISEEQLADFREIFRHHRLL